MSLPWDDVHRIALAEATRALRELAIDSTRRIDPFVALETEGIIVMRQPLEHLAGAYLPADPLGNGRPGVLINANQGTSWGVGGYGFLPYPYVDAYGLQARGLGPRPEQKMPEPSVSYLESAPPGAGHLPPGERKWRALELTSQTYKGDSCRTCNPTSLSATYA